MFFNHPLEAPEPRKPSRVYARIDSIESGGENNDVILLDCIEVDWVKEEQSDLPPFAERMAIDGRSKWPDPDYALSIIAIDAASVRGMVPGASEDSWLNVTLGEPEDSTVIADQYSGLFSDASPRGVIGIEPVSNELQVHLDFLAGWGSASPSSEESIATALDRGVSPDAVAIYDVGQGAATALLQFGVPITYFDFGGSTIGNWRSFPAHLENFCFTSDPPIVLSHWDWDHWSSAIRDPRALNQTWLLPLQSGSRSLGPVHSRFLARLNANANVLWWDPTCQQIHLPSTNSRIVQAAGPANNRNESGLAFVVDKTHSKSRSVLLPGDASFAYLQSRVGTIFDHAMVPHHGGKTSLSVLPMATTKSRSHAIYSYGVGNIFLHPRDETVKAYRLGWKKNTHTALRNHTGFGHVGIDLTGQRKEPIELPCPGSCQLAIQTWL